MITPLKNIKEIDDITDKVNNFNDFQRNVHMQYICIFRICCEKKCVHCWTEFSIKKKSGRKRSESKTFLLRAAAGNSKKSCTVKLGSEGPEPICPAARTWHFEKGSVRGLVF